MRLDWDNLEVQLVRCDHSQWDFGISYSKTWLNPRVNNNDLQIFEAGRGKIDLRQGKTAVNKNSIFWLRPGHTYHTSQELNHPLCNMFFRFELLKKDGTKYYPDTTEIPESFTCFNHTHWLAMARNILRIMTMEKAATSDETKQDIRRTASHMLKSMLMGIDLCDSLTRPADSGSGNMKAIQIAEYLTDSNNNFESIQNAAKHFNMSRSCFTRVFHDFWHTSPQDYIISERMRKAKLLLTCTKLNLDEIADALGYSDRFFFSRQFKSKIGISPGEYRNKENTNKQS